MLTLILEQDELNINNNLVTSATYDQSKEWDGTHSYQVRESLA
jgi:hypothetical protein